MRKASAIGDFRTLCVKAAGFVGRVRTILAAVVPAIFLLSTTLPPHKMWAAANPSAASAPTNGPASEPIPLAESLGIRFIPGSSSTVLIDRDGKTYLINLAERTIEAKDSPSSSSLNTLAHPESSHSSPVDVQPGAKVFADNCAACHGADGKGVAAMKTPDFTNPAVQAALTEAFVIKTIREGKPGTAMPAWDGKLSEAEITAVAVFVKSLGQGKKPEARNFRGGSKANRESVRACRRLPFQPAHGPPTWTATVSTSISLIASSIPPLSVEPGAATRWPGSTTFPSPPLACDSELPINFRSALTARPSLIDRPIELGVAYHFLDEHKGNPLNATVRASLDGQNDFSKNFTPNLEMILSRTVTRRAQLYLVPTLSLQARELLQKPGSLASIPPESPRLQHLRIGGRRRVRYSPHRGPGCRGLSHSGQWPGTRDSSAGIRLWHPEKGFAPCLHAGIFQQPGDRRLPACRNPCDIPGAAFGGHAKRPLHWV